MRDGARTDDVVIFSGEDWVVHCRILVPIVYPLTYRYTPIDYTTSDGTLRGTLPPELRFQDVDPDV